MRSSVTFPASSDDSEDRRRFVIDALEEERMPVLDEVAHALELNISNRNWYGALFVALSLPDICGYLEDPSDTSRRRFEAWFGRYMQDKYQSPVGWDHGLHTFLSASDCYALRCALLHEGRDDIQNQRAREALERFHFCVPPPSGLVHCNQNGQVLQLQVDIFCRDVLKGVREWQSDIEGDADILTRANSLLRIHTSATV